MASHDPFDSADPAAALEKALEVNRIKTTEAPRFTINLDLSRSEKSWRSTSSGRKRVDLNCYQSFGGKNLINYNDCKGELANDMSESQKWTALFIVWLVQISMNFNTSLYSNAIPGIARQFHRSENAARWGATVFLIAYAFGCELWAPWSEELGRYWVLEASLGLVNILQLGVVFATNLDTVIAFRTLGGLSTAGGSISIGICADMWNKDSHQLPVAFVVFASVGGSVLGPIIGGLIEASTSWEWAIWLQLIFGGAVQLLHYCLVPETRATILMDRIAKRKRAEARKEGKDLNLWGPNEITPFTERFSWTEIFATWLRPFKMFVTEPIVLCLSLLSGFSDALIFMFIQSFGLVYHQWDFTPAAIGFTFLPFLLGYVIAWISFIAAIRRNKKERASNLTSERAQFESRLWWLLYLAPCLPIGLLGFAWTSGGPPIHWFSSMVFTCLCGIANYAIYMATIDYMVTAYGPYSASATGGNGWARDFLAGILTPAALPFYNLPLGDKHIQLSSTILACIATVLVACVFVIYKFGPWLRRKSNFAQKLEAASQHPEQRGIAGVNYIPSPGYGTAPASARNSKDNLTRGFQNPLHQIGSLSTPELPRSRVGFSRNVSPHISRGPSRNNSPSGCKRKRPAMTSRAQSMYHDEQQAAIITVDHPALLRPPPRNFTATCQCPELVASLPATRCQTPEPTVFENTVKSSNPLDTVKNYANTSSTSNSVSESMPQNAHDTTIIPFNTVDWSGSGVCTGLTVANTASKGLSRISSLVPNEDLRKHPTSPIQISRNESISSSSDLDRVAVAAAPAGTMSVRLVEQDV